MANNDETTNNAVIDSLVEFAADQLAYREHDSKIHRELSIIMNGSQLSNDEKPMKMMPKSHWEKIKRAALKMLEERSCAGATAARKASDIFWTNMAIDPDASYAVRARAQENLDKIHGVAMPEVQVVIGAESRDVVRLKDLGLDLAEKKQALLALRERRAKIGEQV